MIVYRQLPKIAALLLSLALSGFALGQEETPPPGAEWTPLRLAFVDGAVSFRRAGADDWSPAWVNTPLVEGDSLYAGQAANVEIQAGPRAFVRVAEYTQLGLVNLEPDFMQLELKSGTASLDLRGLPAGYTVELDTPNAVFTIEHAGYYRAGVRGDETRFVTRRGGRATVSVEGRQAWAVSPSEEVIVTGAATPTVATYVAPELDPWDRWNYARTEHEIEALSGRYVSTGVYGAGALDQYGTWRVVPEYGAVWVPEGVGPGWAPYTTGSWIWDPFFGWTWVDEAPWGWAPFHYGRWVYVTGYWAWTPGPVIARPVYAPALVAFFGVAPGVSVRIGIGGPGVGWVALGWGEPLRPWWGRRGFVGAPYWGGWGGPRVVNNVVVRETTVVNVNTIVYQNTRVTNAVVAVDRKQFGGGRVRAAQFTPRERELETVREVHPVRPRGESLRVAPGQTIRPPVQVESRSVIATRPPRAGGAAPREAPGRKAQPAAPAPRAVVPPKQAQGGAALPRPSFGEKGAERPRPVQPPRYEEFRKAPPAASTAPSAPRQQAAPRGERRALPGRPANEQSPRRAQAPGAGAQQQPVPGGRKAAPAQKSGPGAGHSAGKQ